VTATTSKEPQNWTKRLSPAGPELVFAIRGGKGYYLTWAIGVGCLAAFGYGALYVLQGWLSDPLGNLLGGGFFFLIMAAGVAFGLYVVFRLLGSTTYLLAPDAMRVTSGFLRPRVKFEVERSHIRGVEQNYTPPKEAAVDGTWKVLLSYADLKGKTREFSFEGWTAEEARWLAPIVSEWANVRFKSEMSAEFEEASDEEKEQVRKGP
jgi:hypothetical protein